MTAPRTCPECGADLSNAAATRGLCGKCLFRLALPQASGTHGREETAAVSTPLESPEQIGPYRILQKIGEGGMGIVYEAEQETPVRRRVALKLIKWGMDTKQVVARFEAERQALALMNHPNVAKVFDAGATKEGRPYFVMEYVKGVPITEHCDRQRLTTQERLELFMQACDGVQHAHQKGIIHRDIKPSNILVEVRDGTPVSKIIDFGVAKATEQRLTERTLFTEFGQLIGTPEYMSPEQAEMTVEDIDTRTDVYSFGVLLYELLVGALPFDPRELRQAGFDEVRRRIREEEPSKPSTRVSTLGDAAIDAARARQTDARALVKRLRGDLDWITMKALEKDRARRYASATELAADVKRHLSDEPVSAGPLSVGYRLGKVAKRHKVAVAVGLLLGGAAWLAIAGLAFGLGQKSYMQDQRKNVEMGAFLYAIARAETRRESEFLVRLFEHSGPESGSMTVKEILDRGVRTLETGTYRTPEKAKYVDLLGRVYLALGLNEQAEYALEQALRIRQDYFKGDTPAMAVSFENLAALYEKTEREAQAAEYRTRAAEIRQERRREWLQWDDPRFEGLRKELDNLLRDLGEPGAMGPLY